VDDPLIGVGRFGGYTAGGAEIIYAGSGAYNNPQKAVNWWMNDAPHSHPPWQITTIRAGYAYCPNGTSEVSLRLILGTADIAMHYWQDEDRNR